MTKPPEDPIKRISSRGFFFTSPAVQPRFSRGSAPVHPVYVSVLILSQVPAATVEAMRVILFLSAFALSDWETVSG